MKKLVSIALCSLAAAAFALPAAAADDAAKAAGSNASVEGGAALGGTGAGISTGTPAKPRTVDNAGADKDKAGADKNTKPEKPAKRKQERDASSGASEQKY
jgi:hypothetical protein